MANGAVRTIASDRRGGETIEPVTARAIVCWRALIPMHPHEVRCSRLAEELPGVLCILMEWAHYDSLDLFVIRTA